MGKGIGGFISGLFGSENDDRIKRPAEAVKLDPNAYNYGGTEMGAGQAAYKYGSTSDKAQGRAAPQANYQNAYGSRQNALGQRENALQARQQQGIMAAAMHDRAAGRVPSIAEMQAQRDMQRAQAAQMSASASARGAGGMALAQQNAANNLANQHGAISGQAQINAANERMQAERGAMDAYSAMRQGDTQAQGLDQQMQGADAGMAQGQAGLQLQQGALNDARSLGYSQLEHGVKSTQLGAQQNSQAQKSANTMGAYGINAGVGGQNAQMAQKNGEGLVGAFTSLAGAAARGGPVRRGFNYLANEEGPEAIVTPGDDRLEMVGTGGPEVIVPKQDGFIIPAPQTKAIAAGRMSPGEAVVSTWGAGGPNVEQQQKAKDEWEIKRARVDLANDDAAKLENPYVKDLRRVKYLRASNPNLVNEDDIETERRAKAMLRLQNESKTESDKKAADDKKPDEKKAPATLGSRLKAAGKAIGGGSSSVDTSYHGYGGYIPPQLIGARAMGGPVEAGSPYIVGEAGPEAAIPTYGTPDIGKATGLTPVSSGRAGLNVGGGGADYDKYTNNDAALSKAMHSSSGMGSLSMAMANDASGKLAGRMAQNYGNGPKGGAGAMGGFREDGGPVEKGKTYVVGENGAEALAMHGAANEHRREADQMAPGIATQMAMGLLSPIHAIAGGVQGVRGMGHMYRADKLDERAKVFESQRAPRTPEGAGVTALVTDKPSEYEGAIVSKDGMQGSTEPPAVVAVAPPPAQAPPAPAPKKKKDETASIGDIVAALMGRR